MRGTQGSDRHVPHQASAGGLPQFNLNIQKISSVFSFRNPETEPPTRGTAGDQLDRFFYCGLSSGLDDGDRDQSRQVCTFVS